MVTMETRTVQTYEDGTNEYFGIRQGGKYICSFYSNMWERASRLQSSAKPGQCET